MNVQSLRRHHEIETAFAPGDQRVTQSDEVVLAAQAAQLRPREALACRRIGRVEQLADTKVGDLADLDGGPRAADPKCRRRVL